jgi:hypothetical protein
LKSAKESLVREYVGTIPRHYSHYSMSSTSEYVDCASSTLNWWKGPTETNDDGTVSIPFLEWLDERNGTEDLTFYNEHAHFPGVHSLTSRPNLPHTLVGPGALPIPVPAVAYHYFLSVVKAFDIKYKGLSADQCGTCNEQRAAIKAATPVNRPPPVAAWAAHKTQADKGYAHRNKRKEESVNMWDGTILPAPSDTDFPPPPCACRCRSSPG